MSKTDVFLGPSTDEGMSAVVVNGFSTTEKEYLDTSVRYHICGIESIETRTPDTQSDAFGGFVNIEFVNGEFTQVGGAIETVKP